MWKIDFVINEMGNFSISKANQRVLRDALE